MDSKGLQNCPWKSIIFSGQFSEEILNVKTSVFSPHINKDMKSPSRRVAPLLQFANGCGHSVVSHTEVRRQTHGGVSHKKGEGTGQPRA